MAVIERDSGKLLVAKFDGSIVFGCEALPLRADTSSCVARGFDECCFDETGGFLWVSAPLSEREIIIELRETKGYSVVHRAAAIDPFGGSSASFYSTGRHDVRALWLAAGQDGQQALWIMHAADGIRCVLDPNLKNTIPPSFSPSGRNFLVVSDDVRGQGLRKFSYDALEELASCASPGGEDDAFDTSLSYLDETRALVDAFSNRVFAVDASTMTVVKEIVIEGHEPRPTTHYYPGLADESLCTNLSHFQRFGDMVVFVVKRNEGWDLKAWKDRLICFPVNAILDEIAG